MGFKGLIVTDAMEMGGITNTYGSAEAAVVAVKAGVDMVLLPGDPPGAIDALVQAVTSGAIPEPRIDDSVRRILKLKARLGLHRNRYVDPDLLPFRVASKANLAQAALSYEQDLQALFRTSTFPAFDLICLGLGDNGHTASLFPGTAALRERERWVAPQYVEVLTAWRVTFTAPLINAARHSAFLVEGAGKAEVLWRVLEGPYQPDVLPAQMIQPVSGQLHWLVDTAAAVKLQST